jgi:hypothetical protein
MMRCATLATFIGTTFGCLGASAQSLGIGGETCAYWQSSPERIAEGSVWILGYWSGFDAMEQTATSVGQDLGEQGRIAAVKRMCGTTPSRLLSEAAADTYWETQKRNVPKP